MTDADIAWMVDRLGIHASRLLASEHADQLCADLLGWTEDDGTRHEGLVNEGRRLAFRSRGAVLRIRCTCGRQMGVPTNSEGNVDHEALMRCPGCGEEGVISWWRSSLVGECAPMALADLPAWLLFTHGQDIAARTLRSWADDGIIRPVETGALPQGGGRGVRRYDPVVVAAVVLERSMVRRTA